MKCGACIEKDIFRYKKEILSLEIIWIELRDVVLSEIGQAQKDKYHIISMMVKSKKSDVIKTANRMVITRGWRQWGKGLLMGTELQLEGSSRT